MRLSTFGSVGGGSGLLGTRALAEAVFAVDALLVEAFAIAPLLGSTSVVTRAADFTTVFFGDFFGGFAGNLLRGFEEPILAVELWGDLGLLDLDLLDLLEIP